MKYTTIETTRRKDLRNTVDSNESSIPSVSRNVQINTCFAGRIGAIGNNLKNIDNSYLGFKN